MYLTLRLQRLYASLAAHLGVSITRLNAYLTVLSCVVVATLCVQNISSRDPGSLFFNTHTAYTPSYSALRQAQAERFIGVAADQEPYARNDEGATTQLCVGIPSIARDGARYLRTTVGSLLAGLTQEERDGMYIIVFIPHVDPGVHPAYNETWLHNSVDDVLLYDLPRDELDHIANLERNGELHREKGLIDYTYLLKACYAKGLPYIAIIEDDVVALDGWYHRTVNGIRQAEAKSSMRTTARDFLYLRLFYTEEFLGWNSEHWRHHTFWSLMVILGSAVIVHSSRIKYAGLRYVLTPNLTWAICFGLVPWAVILFFAAGKVTVLPLSSGVNEMNNFGCCAQGLVFPREKARDLIGWFESSHVGFADMLIEQYANEHHEQRWALTPSVLQHVGSKSSKGDDFGHGAKHARPVAQNIWNFAFELNQPKRLREAHELAAILPEGL